LTQEHLPEHYRRNLFALAGDYITFSVAMAFADQSTVIPTFVRELTSSAPLIGLTSTLQAGGWLLPQLFAANYVAHQAEKKPFIIGPSLVGRPMMLLLAGATLWLAADHPLPMLIVLYLSQLILWICDGLASVPWFDVLAKAIPGSRRGRYLALSQVVGGLLAVGAGAFVNRILDPIEGLSFPQNYALLFAAAFAFLTISFIFLLLVKEPVEDAASQQSSWREYLSTLMHAMRNDRRFALAIAGRLLAGLGGMAAPFFILYGTEALALGSGLVGLSVTAQVLGRIVGGLLLGFGVERLGNRLTILASVAVTSGMPLLALILGTLATAQILPATALLYLYPLIFFLRGISVNMLGWSFTNYVLDIAPAAERTTYVGLTNTIGGLLIVAPVIGGALLEALSYSLLFVVAFVVYLIALGVSWQLPAHARS
jgi:MFS family permease